MQAQIAADTYPAAALQSSTIRYHYLDNLRALALMLGVLFHSAIAYSLYMNEIWLTAAPEKSTVMEAIAWFSHLFRMPLFMVIAGFFGCYLLQKRGLKGFVKNRSLRILLPLVIFVPLILASFIGLFMYAMGHMETKSPLLQIISSGMGKPMAQRHMPFSTMHLWFLLNLLFFYCATVLVIKINFFSITAWLSKRSQQQLRVVLLLALPLLLTPSLYIQYAPPLHFPDRIYPQLWSFGYYGVFFAVGWILFSNQYLLDAINRYWKPMIIFSIVAFTIVYPLYPRTITLDAALAPGGYVADPKIHIPTAILQGFISVYMVLSLLILGRKFLNGENAFYRYISQSSYWVYLVHVPIILFIQILIADKEWNIWSKYCLTVALAFAASLLSYQLLVRHTPIGWMLNGRK
jgi:glucans biosynthesis protein C